LPTTFDLSTPPLLAARCPSTILHIVSELASARDSLASGRVAQLQHVSDLRVELERAGQPLTLEFAIE